MSDIVNPEAYRGYEWVGEPPDPWLPHFEAPAKTEYCLKCDEWVVPSDSKLLWTVNAFRRSSGFYDEELGVPQRLPALCPACGDETMTKPQDYFGPLNWVWWRHTLCPVNASLGVTTKFYDDLAARIEAGRSVQVVLTGRAGSGKSYFELKLAQILDPFTTIDQVCFTREEFAKNVNELKPKTPVVVDESSYIVGHRSWSNPDQQAVVAIWESMRFTLLPVLTAVINLQLLDKVIRNYMVIYQINLLDRGVGRVYRITVHPLTGELRFHRGQTLYLPMPSEGFCKKPSCLLPACPDMGRCPLLRGQYERRKREIQRARYRAVEEKAKEHAKTFVDWLEDFLPVIDQCYVGEDKKRRLSKEMIEVKVGCSGYQAQRLRQFANVHSREQIVEYIEEARKKG